MKYRKKLSRPIVGLVVAGFMLAGCSGGGTSAGGSDEPEGDPVQGGTAVWGMGGETASLDPAICGVASYTRCSVVFGSLLRLDPDTNELVGQMADSFESSDGINWTLKLREGVKFSDGTPFDAAAVVFNWDRIKDPATLSAAAPLTEGMTWQVVDPTTVAVTLDSPNFQKPWQLSTGLGAIGSPQGIAAAGGEVGNKPVGAGPFVLKQWIRNSEMQFTRNPDYFEPGLPHLDALTVKVINSTDQQMNALRAGEIDVASSQSLKDRQSAESAGFDISEVPMIGGTGILFNVADPALKDDGLQQAMLHAFDGEQINNAVFPGEPDVDAFLAPDNPARDDALGLYPDLNLDEAQKLFDDYLKRTNKTGETITLATYAGIPQMEQSAQLIQAQMQKINGLTVELDPVDAPTILKRKRAGDYQLMVATALGGNMDLLYDTFDSEGVGNFMNYSNPEVDAALQVTRESNDADEVSKAYGEANGLVSEDGVFRLWRQSPAYFFSSQDVHGLVAVPSAAGAAGYWEQAWLTN